MTDKPQVNPFPGLRPFRSDEHHLFFGREEQTAALLQLLRTNRFLAVVGTSGSGKSSLVRAGMIAELHSGTMTQAGSTWEVVLLRPGGSPLENLARALVEADLYDAEDPETLPRLRATLGRSRFGLVEAMKQSDLFEPETNLLVVVDQFEELFRFRQQGVDSEEAATAFVNLLLTASEQQERPIYVTITMRSDYLGDCSEIPGLAEAVNEGEYLIPRLGRDQKRDAIEKPLGVGGAKISSLLVQRLLNDVGDDTDQLPVLQHALMRMWNVWSAEGDRDRPIDFCDFEAIGGLAAALSNHADEIYDALPDDRHRRTCERIFKTLTEKGVDNRGIRRPTRLARLAAIAAADRATVTAVLDAFRQPGVTFLMPGSDIDLRDRTVLDLSHESLMRGWQRLRGWVEEEAQSARIFRRLLDTSRLWREGKAGLFRDPDLQIALTWREQQQPNATWAEQYGGDFETAIQFLNQSAAEAAAEELAREAARQRELEQAQRLAEAQQQRLAQQQRSARRLRAMIGGLAVVAVIAGMACVAALVANNKATELADLASREAENARVSAAEAERQQQVAEAAQQETEGLLTQVERSLATAEAAEQTARDAEEEARRLLYATDMQLAAQIWRNEQATAAEVRDRLDAHLPRAGGEDLRGFEWYYHDHLVNNSALVLSGHPAAVVASASTSGGGLVTLDEQGHLKHWDLTTGGETASLDLRQDRDVDLIALSPDGGRAALAIGKTIHVVETSAGSDVLEFDSDRAFSALAFSLDGRVLVTVNDRYEKIHWWDATTGAQRAVTGLDLERLPRLSLSRDGLILAVSEHGTYGEFVSIFRVDPTTNEVTSLEHDFGGTRGPGALSPDGRLFATCGMFDGAISVLDTGAFQSVTSNSTAHASPPSALAFSPDGTQLISTAGDGTVKVWPDARHLDESAKTLKGHSGRVNHLVLSPDGELLVSSSEDRTARVWDLTQPSEATYPLAGVNRYVHDAEFSPDGWLVAVTDGFRVGLHDATTGARVGALIGDEGNSYSVAFAPDGRTLAVGYGNETGEEIVSHVLLWDIETGEQLARLPGVTDLPGFSPDENNATVGAVAFSPDGQYLVAGFGRPTLFSPSRRASPLKVWDVASRRLIRRLEGHVGHCVSLEFSDDGQLLASGSYDGTARIWSTQNWKTLHTLHNPDPLKTEGYLRIGDVAFSPDRRLLALASREGSVVLWNFESDAYEILAGHSTAVQAVAFSPDGRTLASGSGDKTVRLWNVTTRRQVLRLDSGAIRTMTFSPDGRQLLTAGQQDSVWSTRRSLWDDPERAARRLRVLLESPTDFQTRVRMLSDNLRLHEALAIVRGERPDDVAVHAALVAARANWHAAQQDWQHAAEEFDRLVELGAGDAQAWLRTPGLFRLATALLHEQRPAEAAALLSGGADRRTADGLPAAILGLGISTGTDNGEVRLERVTAGSPAGKGNLRAGDVILKINDSELTGGTIPAIGELVAGEAGTVVRVTVRHADTDEVDEVELVKDHFFEDSSTIELLYPLLTLVNEQLGDEPRDAGLLELRAELAGQWSERNEQRIADYTAAIDLLAESADDEVSSDLTRLYRRRGDTFVALKQWQQAADDYAHVVADDTTDEDLLANHARALAEVMLQPPAWTVLEPVSAESKLGATLTVLDDHSVLASGENPLGDAYTITAETAISQLSALRLEALTDDSLPNQGPGRDAERDPGSFALVGFEVLARTAAGETVPLQLTRVAADYSILDLTVEQWNVGAGGSQPHTAVYQIREPTGFEQPVRLEFRMQFFANEEWPGQNLGRFRLSVASDPTAFERAEWHLAAPERDLDDPWLKLAVAYRVHDDQQAIDQLVADRPGLAGPVGDLFAADEDWERALAVYSRGITTETTDVELLSRRARASEQLRDWDAAAADWGRAAATSPGGATLLADFARRLFDGGQIPSALDHIARSQQLLHQALQADPGSAIIADELASVLLEKRNLKQAADCTSLKPTDITSAGGATFTLEDDGSVFVSGENPDVDTYTLTVPVGAGPVLALVLETIPDPRLPEGGAGRAANGNFRLAEVEATLMAADPDAQQSLLIEEAFVDTGSNSADRINRAFDGDLETFWNHWPELQRRSVAVFRFGPVAADAATALQIQLKTADGGVGSLNLGRFRLSLMTDPAELARVQSTISAQKITDPWVKLAVATALDGRFDEATQIADRAFHEAETWEARTIFLEQLARFDEQQLTAVAGLQPDDPQLQLARARQLVRIADDDLDHDRPADALPKLQQARSIFERLRAASPTPEWTVPVPVEMRSAGGATLRRREDNSILAMGRNPNSDSYTIVLDSDQPQVTGFRLDLLPDPSLPTGFSGRASNGNCTLSEFEVAMMAADGSESPIILRRAISDHYVAAGEHYAKQEIHAGNAIDGNRRTFWEPWPKSRTPRAAIFLPVEPLETPPGTQLIIRLVSDSDYHQYNLGRFRLALTGDPDPLPAMRLRFDLQDDELADLYATLGRAFARLDRTDEAIAALLEGLSVAGNRDAKAGIVAVAALTEGLLEQLNERVPEDALFHAALTHFYTSQGELDLARTARARAIPLLERELAAHPADTSLSGELAEVLVADSTEWTVLDPIQMTSAGGATLTQQPDRSVLVSGVDPDSDSYRLVMETELKTVTAIRLETLTDESLTNQGPGRGQSGGGSFAMSWTVSFEQPETGESTRVVFDAVEASHAHPDYPITVGGWNSYGGSGEPHAAVYRCGDPIHNESGFRFTIEMEFNQTGRNLGRFRISATDDPAAFGTSRRRISALKIDDSLARLGAAYALSGSTMRAIDLFDEAYLQAATAAATTSIAEHVARYGDVVAALATRHPADPELQIAGGRHLALSGLWDEAAAAFERAAELDAAAVPAWIDAGFWKVEGYPYEIEPEYPPELQTNPFAPVAGVPGTGGAHPSELAWAAVVPNDFGRISFSDERCCNYVLTRIWSPHEQTVAFQMGDDDALRLFVNDVMRFQSSMNGGGAQRKEHEIPVVLQPGWNTVLLKLQNAGEGAALILEISDSPAALAAAEVGAGKYEADQLLAAGKTAEAVALLTQLIDQNPRHEKLLRARAEMHVTLKQLEQAIADYDQILELKPDDRTILSRRGSRLRQLKHFDQAIADYNRLLELDPDSPWYLLERAKTYNAQRAWTLALADLNAAVEASPPESRAHFLWNRGDHWAQRGEWQNAADDMRQAYQVPTDSIRKWWAYRNLALIYLAAGDFDGYSDAVEQMIDSYDSGGPNNRWPAYGLTVHPGLITSENRGWVLDLLADAGDFWNPRLTAAVHFRDGDYEQAAELFDRHSTGPAFVFLAAMTHHRLGNVDRAAQLLEEGHNWMQQQRGNEPDGGVPQGNFTWQDWVVWLTLQHEAEAMIHSVEER